MLHSNFLVRLFVLAIALVVNTPVRASVLSTLKVGDGVYALVGSTQNRTYDNHALNNTLGFVVARDGVALIDSGASALGAQWIEAAIRAVSDKPVRWVINLGSQDHRWLGNGYFADKGAKIIALQRTVETQKALGKEHLAALEGVLKDRLAGTRAVMAPEPLKTDDAHFELGGVKFELKWLGDAHYRGDAVLFLPQSGVLFAGDVVFHDRMLGVWPHSPVDAWRDTFRTMEKLPAKIVVPGHGNPGDMAKARRDTGDYLDFLMDDVARAARDWEPLDAVIERLADQPRFKHLEHYDGWHKRNINQTYLQFEGK